MSSQDIVVPKDRDECPLSSILVIAKMNNTWVQEVGTREGRRTSNFVYGSTSGRVKGFSHQPTITTPNPLGHTG